MKEWSVLELVMSNGVIFKGPKLGKVDVLRCTNHNICDPNQFPELQFDKYASIVQRPMSQRRQFFRNGQSPFNSQVS
jgi:hypothetical protein